VLRTEPELTSLPTELVALSAEQEEIIELCRRFAATEIRPVARAIDEADTEVPWDIWRKGNEVGLGYFMLPTEFGGGGFTDIFTQVLVQEELCAGDLAVGNLLTANGFFADPVLELGTPDQHERWLRPLCSANAPMTSLAVTEPGAGSDTASMTTRALRDGGDYLLSGQKTWISNAGAAELYIIFAKTDPIAGARGVSAFVVEKGTPGMTFGAPMKKMGQRALVNAEIFLDEVRVPAEQRLGEEGRGFHGLMRTFDISRTVLAAAAVGCARGAMEFALDYARERVQFGKPIIEHQAVAFRLADMKARVEAARLLVWRSARRLDAGLDATESSAIAKLTASETAMWVTWAAVQTLGGWGYSREFLVEKWMRDAKLEEIEEGTSDIQRLIISRAMARGR
jgi:alkylation response protein AidB-like acyl-CoA dehydrogenase